MAHIHQNMAKFYSKLEEFWKTEKYTDVTIECENKSFKCHRLALASAIDYFDGMFNGNFKESTSENVVLHEIKADAFQEVVRFVYTGDAVVSSTNLESVLRASEFFKLAGLEDLCIQFVEKTCMTMTIQNIFDIFAFACLTQKNKLVDILNGYIAQHFVIFSSVNRFLEISIDELKVILNRWSLSLARNEDSLLGAITRWIYHCREERWQYLDELMKVIRFQDISSEYMRMVLIKSLNSDVSALSQIVKPVGYNEVSKLQNFAVSNSETSLHVFVKHHEENFTRIYSINSALNCSYSGGKIPTTNSHQWVRSVAVDNFYLYCLNHVTEGIGFKQSFCGYTSIDMHSELMLKPPPLILNRVEMCSIQNNLFLYNRFLFNQVIRTDPANLSFNDEEIRRGIYLYNCELDTWFPAPVMKQPLNGSSMAVCNDVLYLIGGDHANAVAAVQFAQAYDYRVGKWRELPKSSHTYAYAACCALGEKIYVSGGRYGTGKQVERYNVTAGKWESVTPMNKLMKLHCALSFSNKLWLMGGIGTGTSQNVYNDLSIEVYNPEQSMWSSVSALSDKADEIVCPTESAVMEAVVFKLL